MELKEKYGLTPSEFKFVQDYVAGRAATWTGARTPNMLAAIGHETRRRLASLAPMALHVVEKIARDERIAPKVRLEAAKDLLNRVGIIPPRAAAERNAAELPLNELSVPDLRALASKLEQEITTRGERAKAIDAPIAPGLDTQAAELLE